MKPFFLMPLVVLLMGNCNKDKIKHYEDVFFQFDMPFSIQPGDETMRVGDTITIAANISDSVYDNLSKKKYYLPEFDFEASASIRELTNEKEYWGKQPSANQNFEFLFEPGFGQVVSERFAYLKPKIEQHLYQYRLKIIPKKPGVYALQITDYWPDNSLPQHFAPEPPGWQRNPMVRLNRYVINEGRTNYQILEKSILPYAPSSFYGSGVLYQSENTFSFIVLQ